MKNYPHSLSFPSLIVILAFCSIVYELVLAQAMAAFLENTVLRYCVTISLYLFSMGIGSLLVEGTRARYPVLTLQSVEILITLAGGFSVVCLHLLDMAGLPRVYFSMIAHAQIIGIGILTGFEIPLLIEIARPRDPTPENYVLGFNYVGAFAGTLCFAFIFYPVTGLMAAAFITGLLNSIAGTFLIPSTAPIPPEKNEHSKRLVAVQAIGLVFMAAFLVCSAQTNNFFMEIYLR